MASIDEIMRMLLKMKESAVEEHEDNQIYIRAI
jgi:hypothetical protein